MQKIITISFLSLTTLMAFTDLGILGATHEIAEKPMLKQLQDGAETVKMRDYQKRAYTEIERAKSVNADIPRCVADREYELKHYYTHTHDAIDLDGNLVAMKGKKELVSARGSNTLCVIDGSTEVRMMYSIEKLSKNKGCTKTLVANTSVDQARGLSSAMGALYPYNGAITKTLGISCYPSKVTVSGTRLLYEEYGVER
jgi:hypothetical protein